MSRTARNKPLGWNSSFVYGPTVPKRKSGRVENHFGNQRKMRSKAKDEIRRRDRRIRSRADQDTGDIIPVTKRTHLSCLK